MKEEHNIQVQVCDYLDTTPIRYWAVPNGFVAGGSITHRARYINYMKAEGMKNGVFDLTLLLGNGQVAFLELKTSKGKPSKAQIEWSHYFDTQGYRHQICYGYDEAKQFIDTLLTNKN
jgi:hypothetical protein